MPPRQSHHISGNHFLLCTAHERVHHYTVAHIFFLISYHHIVLLFHSLLSVPIDRDAMNISTCPAVWVSLFA